MSHEFFEPSYWEPAEQTTEPLPEPILVIPNVTRSTDLMVQYRLGEVATNILLGGHGQVMAQNVKLDLQNFGSGTVLLVDYEQIAEGSIDKNTPYDTLEESLAHQGLALLLATRVLHKRRVRNSFQTIAPYHITCNDPPSKMHYARTVGLVVVCDDIDGSVTALGMKSVTVSENGNTKATTRAVTKVLTSEACPVGVSLQRPNGLSRLREAAIFPSVSRRPPKRSSGGSNGNWTHRPVYGTN
jgi:hypothetical protein